MLFDLLVLCLALLSVATARCSRKYAIRAAMATDRAYYEAVNQHDWQAAIKYVWCKGTASLVEPIGPDGGCVAVSNPFPVTLNFFNDLHFTSITREVRYFNNGTVSIHSADVIVIGGKTMAAHDSYRWYDAKPGTCEYKMSSLYAINWLCLDNAVQGCGCLEQ
jgi:hypothetical protein